MSTTDLYAELLITGTGTVIWLGFLAAAFVRPSLQDLVSNTNLLTLAPIIGVAYVLGIIVDRLGYSIFAGPEKRLRSRTFGEESSPLFSEKTHFILTHSDELSRQMAYNRSRLRVCRAWSLNFFLMGVTAGIWVYSANMVSLLPLPLISMGLGVAALITWRKLAIDYYRNVQSSYAFLKVEDPAVSSVGGKIARPAGE